MQPTIIRTSTADLYDAYVVKNYARPALTLVRGSGCSVWDDQGREYLDFTSGIAVSALGHCHPVWVEAVRRQAGELIHVSNLFRHPLQARAGAAAGAARRPGPGVFLQQRRRGQRGAHQARAPARREKVGGEEGRCYKIICAKGAFHGRTFGGMSATPQEKIQKGFRPLVPGFVFGELNNLRSFADLVDDQTCAIFVETIQGESGINPCTDEFLAGLRHLCDRHKLLLLLDEVQCGVGRTGRFFAFEHAGILPDAIGMAKGLGGGFPIGAVWIRENAAELFPARLARHDVWRHAAGLRGRAGRAARDRQGEAAREGGRQQRAVVEETGEAGRRFSPQLKAVRGRGYLIGLQMAGDPAPYQAALREAGLLAPGAGNNVIRLLPPLIATRVHLDRSVEILRGVLQAKA